jgi:type IV pilus assembly protein PilY1
MLDLSVEWPTGVVQAHNDEAIGGCPGRLSGDSYCYFATKTYIGYFDPYKCYNYNSTSDYFEIAGYTNGASAASPSTGDHTCVGRWSGNYLNWATMQTTDMFRFAMTGGDRFIDTSTLTVLEKARHDGQGGFSQFPLKRIGGPAASGVTPVPIASVTPLSAPITGVLYARVSGLNTVMWVHESRDMLANNSPPAGNNPANVLTVPTNYVENGTCAAYTGGGICVADVSTNPGTRQITENTTVLENGQCPSGTAGVTSCMNSSPATGGTRSVARDTTANNVACPAGVAGETACVFVSNGTRRIVYHEAGSCPATASSGGAINSCANNNPSAGRRRVDQTEPGQCPTAVLVAIPASRTVISCMELTFPTRRVTTSESGQCPVSGSASCMNTSAATPGTRTVVITNTFSEPGQCTVDVADVPPVPRYMGTGTCVDQTAVSPRRSISWPTPVKAYYVRTKTCDPSYPESQTTCVLYGTSTYKPEGLIQANSLKMRFGAFGYLRDNAATRDGGVLRARMKDVGPLQTVPSGPPAANARAEWSAADGTFSANPDSTDASATNTQFAAAMPNVTRSGVIQYLNRFGRAAGYKGFDPVSELYAESLKYMKNGPMSPYLPSTEYYTGANAAMIDGFPVITDWAGDFPIQYSCQKNFIIGIADANTHKDKNLHGGIVGTENEPGTPPTNLDTNYAGKTVPQWTDAVGVAETATGNPVVPSPGTRVPAGSTALSSVRNCCNGSAYLAGLAYYANVTDLRPDLNNLQGIQNIQTFYVDVRESGSWGTAGDPRNQLWLASKYGGFTDNNKNGAFEAGDTWIDATAGMVQGFPKPQNYFAANQPDKLVAGLRSAFNSILSITGSAAGVGLAATNVSTQEFQNGVYQVKYDTKSWTGDVIGQVITAIDQNTGAITTNSIWSAQAKLDAQAAGMGWNTGRVVVTAVPGASQLGQPFRLANLNAAQKAALGGTATIQQNLLDYLRGDKSKETSSGGPFRGRQNLLSDVVDSEAVFVPAPNGGYSDDFNPGYSAFQAARANRELIVYVGANDGMLHAFNGSVSSADSAMVGGVEKFAYVPSFTFNGPSVPATPAVDGLASLANPSFNHYFMVNATPVVRDVDFARAGVDPTTIPVGTKDWRTMLVGGMGKGGRGYYALDITDPTTFTTENGMAANVLWEFTDEDMGYTYGLPWIVKTRKWGWVVLVTSGYNNTQGSIAANKGKGFLYVLNAKTGALLQKISTGVGTAATPSGFAQIAAYTPTLPDFTTDEVYGGDLLGNVWRFDFKSATASVPAPLHFAQLTSEEDGSAQPITTSPRIEYSSSDLKRYVFVGTGRNLDISDLGNTQRQTMYAIRDGVSTFRYELTDSSTGLAIPAGTFPITRSRLANNSDLVAGLSASQITAFPLGWYYDMGPSPNTTPSTPRERINLNPDATDGVLTWVGNLPVKDTCNPNGTSNQYATSYGTGKSKLFVLVSGARVYKPSVTTSALVKSQLVTTAGSLRALGTDQTGTPSLVGSPLTTVGNAQLKNWREVLE